MFQPKANSGFTLLELVIAISIAVLVLSLAVPSITGLQKEQKLKRTFEQFDGFVQSVRAKAIMERHDLLTTWDDDGINVVSSNPGAADRSNAPAGDAETAAAPQHFSLGQGTLKLERPAALVKDPPAEWMFWHSGVCEPAIISYKGTDGSWKAVYDPLTGQGRITEENVP